MDHGTDDMDKLVNEMPDEEKPLKRDRVLINKVHVFVELCLYKCNMNEFIHTFLHVREIVLGTTSAI